MSEGGDHTRQRALPTAGPPADVARRAWAVVQLARPLNVLMIAAGVVVGGLLAGGGAALIGASAVRLWTAALAAACIGAGGNSLNDVLDLRIDRVNRPERPLVTEYLSPLAARLLWAVTTVVGVVLAAGLSLEHVTMALGAAGLLLVYNSTLKGLPVVGNVAVAAMVGLTLIFGGWAVGSPVPTLVGVGFAFLTTWVREILKDLDDVAGDAGAGARTLPLVAGERVARCLVVGLLGLTVLGSPLPFLLLEYTGLFLLLMLVADGLMLRVIQQVVQPAADYQAASTTMKAVMLAGMAALACEALARVSV